MLKAPPKDFDLFTILQIFPSRAVSVLDNAGFCNAIYLFYVLIGVWRHSKRNDSIDK